MTVDGKMRLRYTFSTRTRTSTMGSPTRRTRAQLQRPRETIRTGPLLLAAAFFSFCHGSFGLQHSDPHPRAGSKASPGQDRSHLVREFMASKTNWTEPRDDCTELKHPQQRQPPRDGVLRAGGGLQHEQSLVALLPITSSEHHASALAVLDRPIEEGGWRLICAWFSGVEGADTVTIFVSTLQQGSTTWSGPKEVAREPGASLQNPVWLIEKGSKAADSLAIRLLYTRYHTLAFFSTAVVMKSVARSITHLMFQFHFLFSFVPLIMLQPGRP